MTDKDSKIQEEKLGTVVLIQGFIDEDDIHLDGPHNDNGFWAAVLVPPEKEIEFGQACERAKKFGEDLDLPKFATKLLDHGELGDFQPSPEKLKNLKEIYGTVIDLNEAALPHVNSDNTHTP